MKSLFSGISILLAATSTAFAAEEPAAPAPATHHTIQHVDPLKFLVPGEKLVFRLSWGLLSGAGEFSIETFRDETPEGPRLRVRSHLESKGLANALYELDTNAESLIDIADGRPIRIERTGKEGSRDVHAVTVFNYAEGRVEHTDHGKPSRSGTAKLPEQKLYDLFVTLLQARVWQMKPGDTRKTLASFEDDFYELEATALKTTTVKTPSGRYEAVEVEMKQKGTLKGFFKKGGAMKFWISTGENPQIVRIDGKAAIGTLVMTLARIEKTAPPSPAVQE